MRRATAAGAVALLLAGCGGGGGNRELDEDEYVEEFSAICGDAAADIEEVSDDLDSTDLDEVARAAGGAARIADEMLDDVRALEQEDEGVDAVDLYDELERRADLYAELEEAADDGDEDAVDDVRGQVEGAQDQIEDTASALDIDCEPDDISAAEQLSDEGDFSDETDAASGRLFTDEDAD